jgi:hypothetical protein
MSGEKKFVLKFTSPPGFDETQVQLLVGTINLIANNRVANGGKMHANLMSAACPRNGTKEAETIAGRGGSRKPPFNKKFRLRWRTGRVSHLFKPDR